MGVIAKLLSFTKVFRNGVWWSDVKFDSGGGPVKTGTHFSTPGDDSHPVATDYLVTVPTQRAGREDVVGYVDTVNEPLASPGDRRILGRNSSTGAMVVQAWARNNGEFSIFNDNGFITLQPDGKVNINGVIIDIAGKVITPATGDFVTDGGISTTNHTHTQGNDGNGDTEVPTDSPTATE